jgi:cytochrome c-type biogenesis protein CcmH
MMRALLLMLCLWGASNAWALNVEPPLPDSAQEARAQNLFHQVRCVVCQGEAIADSPADVAGDFRRAIRGEIATGKSDAQVLDYLVSRYGDGVLMNPPLKASTWLLWFGPFALVLLAFIWVWRYFSRTQKAADI